MFPKSGDVTLKDIRAGNGLLMVLDAAEYSVSVLM